jgi:hypothetical protein
MTKGHIVILLIFVSFCDLFSQSITSTSLDSFYIRTINDYFNGDSINDISEDYFVLKDSVPESIIDYFSNSTIYFIGYSEAYPLIKSDSITSLYWIRKKSISQDTIDISIGGWTVDFERVLKLKKIDGKLRLITKNFNFSAWCGGTLGYIPQGRLIFNPLSSSWQYISEKRMIEEKTQIIRDNINNFR